MIPIAKPYLGKLEKKIYLKKLMMVGFHQEEDVLKNLL